MSRGKLGSFKRSLNRLDTKASLTSKVEPLTTSPNNATSTKITRWQLKGNLYRRDRSVNVRVLSRFKAMV